METLTVQAFIVDQSKEWQTMDVFILYKQMLH